MQGTAGYCRVQQGGTAGYGRYCRVLPGTAGYGGVHRVLQGTAGYCRVLQGTAGYCRVLQGTAGYGRVLQGTVLSGRYGGTQVHALRQLVHVQIYLLTHTHTNTH